MAEGWSSAYFKIQSEARTLEIVLPHDACVVVERNVSLEHLAVPPFDLIPFRDLLATPAFGLCQNGLGAPQELRRLVLVRINVPGWTLKQQG
jgi:hypothetical protein